MGSYYSYLYWRYITNIFDNNYNNLVNMIIAYNEIKYDTDLVFEAQEQATIDFINESIKASIDHYNIDDSNRPFEAAWKLDEQTEIVKTYVWNTPAPSCGVEKEVISMRGVEIWHEPNYSIQIKINFKQDIELLGDY